LAAATEKGIKLYLDCGTLLRFIREGRILPWDDDIDLAALGEVGLQDRGLSVGALSTSMFRHPNSMISR
jgi:LicD family